MTAYPSVATIGVALVLVLPFLAAQAQQPPKSARIGFLSLSAGPNPNMDVFRGLRELGWVEGKNLTVEYRLAAGREDQLPTMAADLVRLQVDVIVTASTPAALAAKHATSTIPIVVTFVADPVGSGIVTSLARPGGNITGLTESAARALNLRPVVLTVRAPADFEGAFQTAVRQSAQALLVNESSMLTAHRATLAELAARHRLPAVGSLRGSAEAGFLMSYGPELSDWVRRIATFVDRILRGAKPADLPFEQPTKFERVINLKTAKALRLSIPKPLLLRADQVIE